MNGMEEGFKSFYRRAVQDPLRPRPITKTTAPTELIFNFLNISSLFAWITLLVALMGLCCLDIFLRVLTDIRSLVVVGAGAFVLVGHETSIDNHMKLTLYPIVTILDNGQFNHLVIAETIC